MNTKILRRAAVGSVFFVVALGLGLHTNLLKLPLTVTITTEWLANSDDDRVLVGAAHNVFVGKVVRKVANKNTDIGPFTQFEVAIVTNIKGDFSGNVMIQQQGGYREGVLYVVEGDPLLQPGSTYLFASRTGQEGDETWNVINGYPGSRKLISDDPNLGPAALLSIANSDTRIAELRTAYPNEILLDADVAHDNTPNSYQSLQ
ncbi:MAG: hypothetical protein AAB776_04580 [Patescibacteria group bacterium]